MFFLYHDSDDRIMIQIFNLCFFLFRPLAPLKPSSFFAAAPNLQTHQRPKGATMSMRTLWCCRFFLWSQETVLVDTKCNSSAIEAIVVFCFHGRQKQESPFQTNPRISLVHIPTVQITQILPLISHGFPQNPRST